MQILIPQLALVSSNVRIWKHLRYGETAALP